MEEIRFRQGNTGITSYQDPLAPPPPKLPPPNPPKPPPPPPNPPPPEKPPQLPRWEPPPEPSILISSQKGRLLPVVKRLPLPPLPPLESINTTIMIMMGTRKDPPFFLLPD